MEHSEENSEPVSPTDQFLNSSAFSLSIIIVLESEVPIESSRVLSMLKDVLVPVSPRFSSVMVADDKGEKRWKRVQVKIKDHVKVPIFPSGMSPEFYDTCLDDYISKIGIEELPKSQPLWEVHIINYPTSQAAATLILKLHHSVGDGFSLIGVAISCLKRADNPSLPLTFPSTGSRQNIINSNGGTFRNLSRVFSMVINTVSETCWSVLKSTCLEDDKTPIRSGDARVSFRPKTVATTTFSLDHIKQIKDNVGATINDVIMGIIFLGTRLYMEEMSQGSSKAHSTALVMFNTRDNQSYKSVRDMIKPNATAPWGNYFTFWHVPMPELTDPAKPLNPLDIVLKARQIMNDRKNSLGFHLTGKLLEILKKFGGTEAAARYIHGTSKNTSMAISNVIGPVEQMALADHPIKGVYFAVVGEPQSLNATIMSYMGKLRIAVIAEKGFVDGHKLKSSIESAFEMILKAASESASQQKRK